MTPEELQHLLDGLDRVQAEAAASQDLDEKVVARIRNAREQLKSAYTQAMKPPAEAPPAPALPPPESVPAVPKIALPAPRQPPPLDGNDLWGKLLKELHLLPKHARGRRESAGLDRDIWQDLDEPGKR